MKTLKIKTNYGEHNLHLEDSDIITIDGNVILVEPKKYIPKVGDCVECTAINNTAKNVIGIINDIISNKPRLKNFIAYDNTVVESTRITPSNYLIKQITPDQLQSKYAEIGYVYDFENDTVSKLKWIPKIGDKYWTFSELIEIGNDIWTDHEVDNAFYNAGNCFKTESECQEAIDKIKDILK